MKYFEKVAFLMPHFTSHMLQTTVHATDHIPQPTFSKPPAAGYVLYARSGSSHISGYESEATATHHKP